MRRLLRAVACAAALALLTAGPSLPAVKNKAWAHAVAVKVLLGGQQLGGTPLVAAPPDAAALSPTFSYPVDGSVVSTGALSATAATNVAPGWADGEGSSEVSSLRLFGGEITATKLTVKALAGAGPNASSGGTGGARITGLMVLGRAVTPTPNLKVPLADWGYANVLAQRTDSKAPPGRRRYRTWVSALDIHLTAAHGGLPTGSQIVIGSADAGARAKAVRHPRKESEKKKQKKSPPPKHTQRKHEAKQHQRASKPATHHRRPAPKSRREPPEPKISPFGPAPIRIPPKHKVRPSLTTAGYVFPVFGPSSFTDTFGAARADTGWHHGDDIFAPLGAPVLAVAKGTVFSVGWNDIGGNRLWLEDTRGNQFYYAHLSAFSPLAVNGGRVSAGDVIGFVGNTGDAEGTPYHLHFEIHPRELLGQGYDGVVDPTAYLRAWKHLHDLAFSNVTKPNRSGTALTPRSVKRSRAPEPGAILLHVADISSAPALDDASVKKALYTGGYSTVKEGDNLLVGSRAGS